MADVALGFRVHLGWAACVAITGPRSQPRVVERVRLPLSDPDLLESHEPYHAGRGLDPVEAEGVVYQGTQAVLAVTRASFRGLTRDLGNAGHAIVGSGILTAGGSLPDDLERILAAHSLVHVAEGRLFRRAIAEASEAGGIAVTEVPERLVFDVGGQRLRASETQLRAALDALGRDVGPPWAQDQKLAALVGWIALVR